MSERTEFTYKGLQFVRTLDHDYDAGVPWENADGHGVITGWLRDDLVVGGKPIYEQPERFRLLNNDRDTARYYDWTQSLERAEREQWGLGPEELQKLTAELGKPPSPSQITSRAVRLDYEFIRGWCRDEWWYVWIQVTLKGTQVSASVGGVESCNTKYIEGEVSTELAEQCIEDGAEKVSDQIDKLLETLEVLHSAIPRPARLVRYTREEIRNGS